MHSLLQPTRLLLAALALTASTHAAETPATVVVRADQPRWVIDKNIYGHFAEHLGRCIYEGIWVGENSGIPNTRGVRNDVFAALKGLNIPVLRWPGGCFADEYHWKDGIGPREKRPQMINTHWGGVVENNHFGTHEFLDLCEQLGTEPYVCGNVGSGSVQEMMEWVEYMTSDANSPLANLRRQNGREKPWKIRYFGVGNESWGCGGNMRPEYYADQFRRYNTFVKNYPGNSVFRIACGPNGADYDWTDVMMRQVGRRMNGLSLHYYTITTGNWDRKGSATQFTETEWNAALRQAVFMEPLLAKHSAIMDRHDPERRVALIVDEWGTWHDNEPGTNPGFLYQQNTLRDALVASLTFDIFHQHSDRVRMANIAQTINVLQAMILTDKEKMVLTPTYHVFEMNKVHQDATNLTVSVACGSVMPGRDSLPQLSASASRSKAGKIHVSLSNVSASNALPVTLQVQGATPAKVTGRVLTGNAINAHNTFDAPEAVAPKNLDGIEVTPNAVRLTMPARSVVVLSLE